MKYLTSTKPENNSNESKRKKQTKYKIDNEDVVDAHFEEIDPSKSDKQKDNF